MRSLAELIEHWARTTPDRPVLTFEGRTTSFAELDERASRVASALIASGVGPQDRVVFLDLNTPEFFEVLFGCGKANAVNVAVNWRLAPPEIAYVINDTRAKVMFVGTEFLPQIEQIRADLEFVETVIVLGDAYGSWVGEAVPLERSLPSAPDDVCVQLYTSGTTGVPKGAMITNENWFSSLAQNVSDFGYDDSSVNLVAMPVFHIAGSGWALCGMYAGAHSLLLRTVDPAQILEVMTRHGVSHALFVPAVIQFLLMQPGCETADFSSLRLILYGASPISEDVLVKAIKTFGCEFMQAYGLTETTGGQTLLRPRDHDPAGGLTRLRSCGRPIDGVELRIVDAATGEQVPTGAVGEVWMRSAQVMKGYWNMPEETARTITPDGWLRSGDAGYVDADGYLYLHDRVKDMIVSGGENIYPAEIENALMSHPEIADVGVIGVPSERWGETVKAVVVRSAGSALTEDAIIAYARERLAHYKCPSSVDFVDELPRNPSGKLLKRELREPYWTGVERRIN